MLVIFKNNRDLVDVIKSGEIKQTVAALTLFYEL